VVVVGMEGWGWVVAVVDGCGCGCGYQVVLCSVPGYVVVRPLVGIGGCYVGKMEFMLKGLDTAAEWRVS